MQSLVEQVASDVRYHAHRTHRRVHRHVAIDDLLQEGFVGVLEAAQRYDADRGVQFNSFAKRRIAGAMLDYVRREVPGPQHRPGKDSRLPIIERLDDPNSEVRHEIGDTALLPDEVVMRSELLHAIAVELAKLPERTRQLFGLLYGVADLTMSEAGKRLGISEGRVSQIHTAAIALIRAGLKERAVCQ